MNPNVFGSGHVSRPAQAQSQAHSQKWVLCSWCVGTGKRTRQDDEGCITCRDFCSRCSGTGREIQHGKTNSMAPPGVLRR